MKNLFWCAVIVLFACCCGVCAVLLTARGTLCSVLGVIVAGIVGASCIVALLGHILGDW